MKIVSNIGGVVSLLLVAVGLLFMSKLGLVGKDLGTCILAFVAAPCLSLGLYVFVLRQRIAALEVRVRELVPEKRVQELT